MSDYKDRIEAALSNCLTQTDFPVGTKYVGKVHDVYDCGKTCIIVTTDRQSAFDRVLGAVPFKGQVLNQCSAWWFNKTKHIVPNHVLDVPDPNVMFAKKCDVLPIEFVVRGYITGTTSTSLWTQYNNGVREYCGVALPEGLQKNQKLERPVITPTTKAKEHDRPISPEEIVREGWLKEDDWHYAKEKALALYKYGAKVANEHGLILVDTKYEFGKDLDGNIILVDEIHTPDSSRYWVEDSYAERFANGLLPLNIDKEFLRLWFVEHCDPYNDKVLPQAPDELIVELSSRYIALYERITGNQFQFTNTESDASKRFAVLGEIVGRARV